MERVSAEPVLSRASGSSSRQPSPHRGSPPAPQYQAPPPPVEICTSGRAVLTPPPPENRAAQVSLAALQQQQQQQQQQPQPRGDQPTADSAGFPRAPPGRAVLRSPLRATYFESSLPPPAPALPLPLPDASVEVTAAGYVEAFYEARIGQLGDVLDKMFPTARLSDRKSMLCKSVDRYTGIMSGPCSHEARGHKCDFAHSYEELRRATPPEALKRYTGEDAEITFLFSLQAGLVSIQGSLGNFFPTKLAEYNRQKDHDPVWGSVCMYWRRFGACPYHKACHYLHVDLSWSQSKLCPGGCEPEMDCVFAHSYEELVPPADLSCFDETGRTRRVFIGFEEDQDSKPLDIPEHWLLRTPAALEGRSRKVCTDDSCDRWSQCPFMHIHPQFWERLRSLFFSPSALGRLLKPKRLSDSGTFRQADRSLRDMFFFPAPPEPRALVALRCSVSLDCPLHVVPVSKRYRDLLLSMARRNEFEAFGVAPNRVLWHPSFSLGAGGSAEIFLGIREEDGMECAVKRYDGFKACYRKMFEGELRQLIEHHQAQGLVHHLTSHVEDAPSITDDICRPHLVLQLMEGSLRELVSSWGANQLIGTPHHVQAVRYLFGSIMHTLSLLGARDPIGRCFLHRDIKPENILVDAEQQIKLIDLGSARQMTVACLADQGATASPAVAGSALSVLSPRHAGCESIVSTVAHTLQYASPEVLCRMYGSEPAAWHATSDICSAGLVLLFALAGKDGWADWHDREKFYELVENNFARWPHKMTAALQLVKSLTAKLPDKRGRFGALGRSGMYLWILSHPFFWPDSQCASFLVALANLVERGDTYGIQDRLEAVIKESPSKALDWLSALGAKSDYASWVEEYSRGLGMTPTAFAARNPLALLRLIRDGFLGRYAQGRDVSVLYRDFFAAFPNLVVSLWKYCKRSDILSFHPILSPSLHGLYVPNLEFCTEKSFRNWF